MEIIGYVGVLPHENNLDYQKRALRRRFQGIEIVTEPAGQMRRTMDEFNAMVENMSAGDMIIVTDFDRMAMSLRGLMRTLLDLWAQGIEIYEIKNQIDSRANTEFYRIVSALDAFDGEIDVSNQEAGIALGNLHGKRGGRPAVLTDRQVELARQRLIEGAKIAAICEELSISTATLYRYFPGGRRGLLGKD